MGFSIEPAKSQRLVARDQQQPRTGMCQNGETPKFACSLKIRAKQCHGPLSWHQNCLKVVGPNEFGLHEFDETHFLSFVSDLSHLLCLDHFGGN